MRKAVLLIAWPPCLISFWVLGACLTCSIFYKYLNSGTVVGYANPTFLIRMRKARAIFTCSINLKNLRWIITGVSYAAGVIRIRVSIIRAIFAVSMYPQYRSMFKAVFLVTNHPSLVSFAVVSALLASSIFDQNLQGSTVVIQTYLACFIRVSIVCTSLACSIMQKDFTEYMAVISYAASVIGVRVSVVWAILAVSSKVKNWSMCEAVLLVACPTCLICFAVTRTLLASTVFNQYLDSGTVVEYADKTIIIRVSKAWTIFTCSIQQKDLKGIIAVIGDALPLSIRHVIELTWILVVLAFWASSIDRMDFVLVR